MTLMDDVVKRASDATRSPDYRRGYDAALAKVEQVVADYGAEFENEGNITHEWIIKGCLMRVAKLRKQETDTL